MFEKAYDDGAIDLCCNLAEKHQEDTQDDELRLIIIPEYYLNVNFHQTGTTGTVRVCLKICKNDERHLEETGGPPGIKRLRIFIYRDGKTEELFFPEDIGRRIAKFLTIKKFQDIIDCGAFVLYAVGKSCRRGYYVEEKWRTIGVVSETLLCAGDVISMTSPDGAYFYHWAIYIGRGLYISKLGKGSPIGITTFSELRKMYSDTGDQILVMSPDMEKLTERQKDLAKRKTSGKTFENPSC